VLLLGFLSGVDVVVVDKLIAFGLVRASTGREVDDIPLLRGPSSQTME
jgi:hypothetical protein